MVSNPLVLATVSKLVLIGDVGDFPPGRGHIVIAGRKPIAVFNVDGDFYALNNVCPHLGGPIGAGKLTGTVVACPYHQLCFDVTTGKSADEFGHHLQQYQLRIEDNKVFIDAWWTKRR